MRETVLFEKVIPNIDGIPLKVNEGHSDNYVKKGTPYASLHIHSELELLYIFSGEFGTRLSDGSEYIAQPGDVVCINSNVAHATFAASTGNMKYGLIQFKADAFKKSSHSVDMYLSIISNSKGRQIEIFRNAEVNQYCEFLFNHAKDEEPSRMMYLTSGVYGLMASLYKCKFIVDESQGIDRKKAKKLMTALEFISDNYKYDISLADVCETVGMSNYYFCRLFKNTLNMGFTDYLNTVRISHAEEMLSETDKSILETALENGFSSVSYFNRVFKSLKNCSPSEYRRFSKEAVKISKE